MIPAKDPTEVGGIEQPHRGCSFVSPARHKGLGEVLVQVPGVLRLWRTTCGRMSASRDYSITCTIAVSWTGIVADDRPVLRVANADDQRPVGVEHARRVQLQRAEQREIDIGAERHIHPSAEVDVAADSAPLERAPPVEAHGRALGDDEVAVHTNGHVGRQLGGAQKLEICEARRARRATIIAE